MAQCHGYKYNLSHVVLTSFLQLHLLKHSLTGTTTSLSFTSIECSSAVLGNGNKREQQQTKKKSTALKFQHKTPVYEDTGELLKLLFQQHCAMRCTSRHKTHSRQVPAYYGKEFTVPASKRMPATCTPAGATGRKAMEMVHGDHEMPEQELNKSSL